MTRPPSSSTVFAAVLCAARIGFGLPVSTSQQDEQTTPFVQWALSLAAAEPGVDFVSEAGVDHIRAKSVRQTEFLIELWQELLAPFGVTLNSPRDPTRRGSHVSLGHPEGFRIAQSLIDDMHVIPDFRAPDNIRLGVSPLYTTFSDVYEAIQRLRRVIGERLYESRPIERAHVT
jgi:kynureninase